MKTCLFAFLLVAAMAPAAFALDVKVEPFVHIIGGMDVETLQTKPGDDRQDRVVTLALTRFGLHADVGAGFSLLSEFDANAGPHGTSVWEGQAALQVRQQLARFERWGLLLEAGRIIDPTSVDFFSAHIADQLLTDPFTRYPLLASGFNLGNGMQARYELWPGLVAGLSLNAANPTSTTASLVVGGTYPPFSRFYFAPAEQVGRDANKFPSDEYYIIVLTPSVSYHSDLWEAQAGIQMFSVDTNTSTRTDPPIRGYNIRGGVGLHTLGGKLHPFLNASRVINGVLDPNGSNQITDTFTGITVSGGLDVNYYKLNGLGFEYAYLLDQQGRMTRTAQQYINVGTTFWVGETTAIGARLGIHTLCADQGMGCQDEGERSFFLTVRTALSTRL